MTSFFSYFFVVPQKVLWRPENLKPFLRLQKEMWKWKMYVISPLIWDWDDKGQDCIFVELPTSDIVVSLKIEIHKNRTWSIKTKLVFLLTTLNLFSATNFGILFIIIVLQYVLSITRTLFECICLLLFVLLASPSKSEHLHSLEW